MQSATAAAPSWVGLASNVIRRLPAGRYVAARKLAGFARQPFLRTLPESFSFRCDLRDGICREVCFTGMYEPQETAILKCILKPGMTFVDVGANWGYFTLLAAQATGPRGRVLSLEPDPRLYSFLRENLSLNGCSGVVALQLAAAAEPGVLTLAGFDEAGDNWGLSHLVGNTKEGGPQYQVEARPLDEILPEFCPGSIDLLKMDIEGAEALALPGMQDTLARKGVRRLLIELHPGLLPNFSSDSARLIALIQKHGYRVLTIDHSSTALRQAAYDRHPDPAQFLSPFIPGDSIDNWPHLLCTAPGVAPF